MKTTMTGQNGITKEKKDMMEGCDPNRGCDGQMATEKTFSPDVKIAPVSMKKSGTLKQHQGSRR